MRTWLAGLLLFLAFSAQATFAPVTVELQDDFADGIAIAQTDSEGGAETIWTSTAAAGTTVREFGGNFEVTSSGATAARARIQTKPDWRANFFVQPLKFTFTGLDFTGTPVTPAQEDFFFFLSSTQEIETTAADVVLLTIRGNGRTEITKKVNGGAVTSLFTSTPGWTPTGATLVIDESSYFLTLTTATQLVTFSGAHGLAVSDWGVRGDSSVALSGRHVVTPADGQTAIIVLSSFRAENLKFFDGFNNGVLEDTGHRPDFWIDTGTVAETGNVRTITGVGSSVGVLSKDFNFFAQKLKFRAKVAQNWAGSTDATAKMRFAVNSQAAGTGASHDSFAVALSPDSGGRIKAGWKTNNSTAVPEDTNTVLNVTGVAPASFDLTLDRDDYSIAAFTSAGIAIDLNGATAGTTLTGTHNINWYVWGPNTAPVPMTADSAIVIENTGAFSQVSTWDRVQVERLNPYYLAPTVFGPIADNSLALEVPPLDPVEHPLLERGFVDVTAAPFLADPAGVVDSTNALEHAVRFARENYLVAYLPCGDYLYSDTIESAQSIQLRTHKALTDDPTNDEEGATVIQAESGCANRPELHLAANASGFNNASNPKPAIRIWARRYLALPASANADMPGVSFSNQFMGVDIDLNTTPASPGATGLAMRGAQSTTIQETKIDATGAFAGIDGLPGSGGNVVDVEVTEGTWCISGGSQPAPTVIGLTCDGGQINYTGRQTLVLVGADLRVENGENCVRARGGAGLLSADIGLVAIIDSQCRYPSANANNDAIDSDHSFFIKDSYFENAAKIGEVVTNDLISGNPTGWTHVTTAAKGIDPTPYNDGVPAHGGPHAYLHTRYMNGTRTLANVDLLEEVIDEAPPGDLQSKHLAASWPNPATAVSAKAAPYNAVGDFITDDTEAIQDAIDANVVTFLPRGIYRLTAPLILPDDKALIGASRTTSVLVSDLTAFADEETPQPLVQTSDSATSTAKLGFIKFQPQAKAPGSYAVNWRAGEGVLRDINVVRFSQFGFGTVTGQGGVAPCSPNQLVLFSGNAGGKVYTLNHGEADGHGPSWRHFKVDGTTNPLAFYNLNAEHGKGEANVEVANAQNVDIYGVKSESNYPVLWIRDSDFINMYGYGGNGAAYEPTDDWDDAGTDGCPDPGTFTTPYPSTFTQRIPSLVRIDNTPNWELADLFDTPRLPGDDHPVFGQGQPPTNWHFVNETPPGSVVESLTLALDRPVFMSRKTIVTPPIAAVTIAGSAVVNNTASYAASVGADRAVVWASSAALGSALIDFQSATYAAQAMTVRAEGRRTTGTSGRSVSFSDVLEANIPSGSGAITGIWDVAPGTNDGWALTLDGVDQSAPVRDSDSAECPAASSCTLPAMTVEVGDLVLAQCQVASGGVSIAASAGYTVLFNTAAPLTAVMVKAITADGTETPGCVYGGAANSVMAGVVYAVSEEEGTGVVVLRRRRE